MLVCLKSDFSDELEFNNLQDISLQTTFKYNFFEPDEKNSAIQEDPNRDPLLKRRFI